MLWTKMPIKTGGMNDGAKKLSFETIIIAIDLGKNHQWIQIIIN